MRKIYIFSFILLGVLFFASNAFATVGGPIFIYDFKYNPVDESVYYIEKSEGGRGCPPELLKISLNSGKSQVVYSCDEGEKLVGGNNAINKIIQNFKDLTPINLKENRISIDISFVNYEKMSPEDDWIKNANFIASVYQDNKKIIDFPISGCNLKQPFLFAGYAIPGFDKKIVLLLSTKGDCWEGGYTYETLHVVGGVNNLNKTNLTNFYKGSSALVPNEGTLMVFESEGLKNQNEEVVDPKSPTDSNKDNGIMYAILAIILGLGLGYFFGKKSAK